MGETIFRIISFIVIWAVAIVSALAALSCYKLLTELAVTNAGGEVDEETELIGTGKKILFCVVFAVLTAGFASAGNPAAAIVLSITLIVAVNLVTNTTKGGVALTATLFQLIGAPLTVGIVADIIKDIVARGFNWRQLLFLIVPAFHYIVLAIATAAAENNEEEEKEGDEESHWRLPIRIIAYIMAVVLAVSSIGFTVVNAGAVKAAEEQAAAEEAAAIAAAQAAQAAAVAEETEEPETVLEFDARAEAEKAHAILLSGLSSAPEEEQAIFKSGKVVGQLDETDEDIDIDKILEQFEMPKSEEARKEAREGYKALLNDYTDSEKKIEIYPVWDSYPVNLETMSAEDPTTGETLTYERTHSGWLNDYVKKVISWATARIFGSKGNDEESFRERMVYTIKNYPAFVELLELHKEATVLGKKMGEVFPFFEEGVKIANQNQEEGIGIYGVLENVGTTENPQYKYTEEWENIMADYYLWLDHVSYDGTFEWWTRERGYLGPADGTVDEDMQHDFDYSSVADNRANFTTDTARQTNLPSEIFCLRDKQNGYRVSDFMGINMVTSDAELYVEAPKQKKATLDQVKDGGGVTVVDYTLPTKQQAAAATKVTYTASTGEVKKVTPTPTPKPTSTPRKKQDKKIENDPQYKPENAIIAGTNIGENLDVFQPVGSVPQTWSTNVETSQGGNESAYTAAIEAGTWTPSGETNSYVPPAGTTVAATVTDETGTEHNGTLTGSTDASTGAAVADGDYTETASDGSSQEVHVDHAEAETEAPHDVDTSDHDTAGSEVTGNDASWDGDESF